MSRAGRPRGGYVKRFWEKTPLVTDAGAFYEVARKLGVRFHQTRSQRGYLYFAESVTVIKVGWSQRPSARIREQKCLRPVVAVGLVRGVRLGHELDLHRSFGRLAVGSERYPSNCEPIRALMNWVLDSGQSAEGA